MIKPTIGRRVWYRPGPFGLPGMTNFGDQPLDAGIVYVWGDRCVNLDVTDHAGRHHALTSVTLLQEGDAVPGGHYAEWMPYQTGQAKAHAAKES